MASEFILDLCFIRESSKSPFRTMIDEKLQGLFKGVGTWYVDHKVEDGLDIATAEVKGLGTWECEDELLRYIEESMADEAPDCWDDLQGYNVQVIHKEDAGCCRLQKR